MTQNNRPLKIYTGLAAATAVLIGIVTYNYFPEQPAAEKSEEPAAVAVTVTPEEPKAETTQPAAAPEAPAASAEAPAPAATAPAATEKPAEPVKEAVLPAFDTVRVEKTGEAIIAGTAAPGAEIAVKLNGTVVGKGVANNDGAWVVVPDKPLAPGTGELSIEQKAPGGETVVSQQTVAVAVPEAASGNQPMVAVLDPNAPTKVLQTPDATDQGAGSTVEKTTVAAAQPATDQSSAAQPAPEEAKAAAVEPATQPAVEPGPAKLKVALDSVDYDDKGNIVFSGRAGAGASVRVYVDNAPMGDARSGTDGKWTWTGKSEIAPGNHALRVDQIDDGGKVLNRVEIPFMREEPERVVALKEEPKLEQQTAPAAGTQDQSSTSNQTTVAATPEATTTEARIGRVIIQPGNNLWKLSRVIYGRGRHYTMIFEANKGQIRNPNRIYPGQIFTTPQAQPPEQIDPKRKVPLTPEEGGVKLD